MREEQRVLVEGWLRGDEASVRMLFEVYFPRSVRIATLSGLSFDAARDCAQETFVHAFERRAQLRDAQAFPLWFHRILTRHILDALGASPLQHEEHLEEAAPLTEDWQRREMPQPDTLAVAAEVRAELWHHVQTLSSRYRVPLVLRYYGDYSTREVAELLGAREGTVRVMLHRALGQLRSRMNPPSQSECSERQAPWQPHSHQRMSGCSHPATEEGTRMSSQLTENNESQQEQLLRAALREHAPTNIDVAAAWESVVPRLMFAQAASDSHRSGNRAGTISVMPGVKRLLRGPRVLLIAAAATVIVLLLAGAAFGTPYWGGLFGGDKAKLIGDERLYTAINQSQTVGEVTITIDKVYADPGNTYIALTIRLPRSLAGTYNHTVVNKVTIANVNGQQPGGMNVVCDPPSDSGSVTHCLIDTAPLHPNPDVSHLTLTVDIGEVWLLRPSVHDPDVRGGPWHFTFTIPFHQQNLGASGPYAQPTPSQNP